MSATNLMGYIFIGMAGWRLILALWYITTAKETLSVDVIVDALGLIFNALRLIADPTSLLDWFWVAFWGRFLWVDYKRWKDTDDDDEFKGRRRRKIVSLIPKPKVVPVRALTEG